LKLENAEYDLSGCAKCQLATRTTVNTNWIGYRSMRSVGLRDAHGYPDIRINPDNKLSV